MKKKVRRIFCGILVLTLCLGITTPTMAATAAKYKAAVTKYQKFLKTNQGSYNIIDLDKNGIPELIIHNTSTFNNEVYTYNAKTKKMIRMRRIGMGKGYAMGVKYSAAKHQVMMPTANTGGSTIYIYRINGQKSTKVLEAEYINGKFGNSDPKYRRGYKINGKRVSEAAYSRKLNSMTKGFKRLIKTNY